MSYANHPLLCTSVPVPNAIDVPNNSGWTCSAGTAGGNLTINPKTINASLVVGDLMLLEVVGTAKHSNRRMDPATGWNMLAGFSGTAGSGAYEFQNSKHIYWKFYVAADDKNHDFPVVISDTFCYNLLTIRSVSKRVPFPFLKGYCNGPTMNGELGFHWGVPPIRMQGTFQNIQYWHERSSNNDAAYEVPGTDFDPDTSVSYLGPTGMNLIASTWKYNRSGSTGNGSGVLIFKGVPSNQHENRVTSAQPALEANATNQGYSGQLNTSSAADGDRSAGYTTPYRQGDSTSPSNGIKYLEWEFDASAGDECCILQRSYGSRSNTYGASWTLTLVKPDGTYYKGIAIQDQNHGFDFQDCTSSYSELASAGVTAPDATYGHLQQTGSSFESPMPCFGGMYINSLPSTGTYKVRMVMTQYPMTAFSTTHSHLYLWVDYVAVALNGNFPSWTYNSGTAQATGAGTAYDSNESCPFYWLPDLDDDWTGGGGQQPLGESNRHGSVIAVFGDPNTETFPPARLWAASAAFGHAQNDLGASDWMHQRGGSVLPPPGFGKVNTSSNQFLICDRPIFPDYYATENAASPTMGKYYIEYTCNKTVSDADDAALFLSARIAHRLQTFSVGGGAKIAANGTITQMRTGASVATGLWTQFVANDVIGVAIDYDNDAWYCYLNGTLKYTGVIVGELAAALRMDFVPGVMQAEDDNCGWDVNITGPFTYSIPSGFVAWDWTNETA